MWLQVRGDRPAWSWSRPEGGQRTLLEGSVGDSEIAGKGEVEQDGQQIGERYEGGRACDDYDLHTPVVDPGWIPDHDEHDDSGRE